MMLRRTKKVRIKKTLGAQCRILDEPANKEKSSPLSFNNRGRASFWRPCASLFLPEHVCRINSGCAIGRHKARKQCYQQQDYRDSGKSKRINGARIEKQAGHETGK